MEINNNIVVLIPTYEPDQKFINLINKLNNNKFTKILVINDGSSPERQKYFDEVNNYSSVTIVTHTKNQGKGRALKTGFSYVLKHFEDVKGCVTVDADGQHLTKDIEECVRKFVDNPDKLILGIRDFNDDSVPLRSRFGNKITRQVLNLFVGVKISDTQTGLRVMSLNHMRHFIKVTGERYEFELNMLIETKELSIDILEVPINTVYIEGNESSHFSPVIDSVKIYKVFLKYISSSLFSSVVDIVLFTLLIYLLQGRFPYDYILVSTVVARAISVLVNYNINSKQVFRGGEQKNGSFYRYISLAIVQMLASAYLVSFFTDSFVLHETATKILVDIFLFYISFVIQREFVFVKEKK